MYGLVRQASEVSHRGFGVVISLCLLLAGIWR
jgi:hypothetical protein